MVGIRYDNLWPLGTLDRTKKRNITTDAVNRSSTKLVAWCIKRTLLVIISKIDKGSHSKSMICSEGLASLSSNEYLVLAGTLHGIHAITSRLSPAGRSSGVEVIEAETFKMSIFLTATGKYYYAVYHTLRSDCL